MSKSHRIFLENVRRRLEESLDELSDLETAIKLYVESILPELISQFDGDPKMILDNLVTKLQMYAMEHKMDIQKVYLTFEKLLAANSIEGLGEIDCLEKTESMLTDADKALLESAVKSKMNTLLDSLDISNNDKIKLRDIIDTNRNEPDLEESVEKFQYTEDKDEVTMEKLERKCYNTLADYFL